MRCLLAALCSRRHHKNSSKLGSRPIGPFHLTAAGASNDFTDNLEAWCKYGHPALLEFLRSEPGLSMVRIPTQSLRTKRMSYSKRQFNIYARCLQDPRDASKARLFLSPITGTGFTPTSFGAWFTRLIKKECGAEISPGRLRCVYIQAHFWHCLAYAGVFLGSHADWHSRRHMFVDARMSVDGGSGLNNRGIAQVMPEVHE